MPAERILSLFRGRSDVLAVQNGNGFRPEQLKQTIPPKWFAKTHLAGEQCLGFYLMTEDSKVFCSAVDFDNKPDSPDPDWQRKTEQVYYALCQLQLSPLVEISQSGNAAHVWLFFSEAIDAWLVRKFWQAVSDSSGVPFVEVYPRQDRLSGKHIGNLIRYPLWNQSRFVDVEHDWQTIEPETALEVAKVEPVTIASLVYQLTGSVKEPETETTDSGLSQRVERLVSRQHTLLGRRWLGDMEGLHDRSRSALVLSIACELVRLYVPTNEIEQALRVWCDQHNYDKGEREDWIATSVQKAYEFIGGRDSERVNTSQTMKDAVLEYIDTIATEQRSIESGVPELDRSIDGVGIGEMAIIAARPSQGKTAFGLWWIDRAAASGISCLIISEEMSRRELAKRALLSISRMEQDNWKGNESTLKTDTEEHFSFRSPIYVVESCQSIDAVEQTIRYHVEVRGVRLVAVDYLQLLSAEHNNGRYEVVTEISRRMKQCATKYRIALLVMCQLNREIEKRKGGAPQLSDLRESGQIEQDADLVLFLQWPFRSNQGKNPKQYLVYCAKRRNGPIRVPVVETTFDPERQTFGTQIEDLPNYCPEFN